MGELLRTLVGEDALTFTSLLSRYSTLAQIITLLTVGLCMPYSVKSDLGKNPVGKSAQVKVIITMLKLNRNSILLSTSNIPCPSVALHCPLLTFDRPRSDSSSACSMRFPISIVVGHSKRSCRSQGTNRKQPMRGYRTHQSICDSTPTSLLRRSERPWPPQIYPAMFSLLREPFYRCFLPINLESLSRDDSWLIHRVLSNIRPDCPSPLRKCHASSRQYSAMIL
jgi:hypothetical protein